MAHIARKRDLRRARLSASAFEPPRGGLAENSRGIVRRMDGDQAAK